MPEVISSAYDSNATCQHRDGYHYRKPLFIGCSGGAGHNSAIMGIINYLTKCANDSPSAFGRLKLTKAITKHYDRQINKEQSPNKTIEFGLTVQQQYGFISKVAKTSSELLTEYPVLPDRDILDKEINVLSQKNGFSKARQYVDMLLDVYPAGYESAAIWNIYQRQDNVEMLRRCIKQQSISDDANAIYVKSYFFLLLALAANSSEPYTEVISTQAMCLGGLCDAIIEYNIWLEHFNAANATHYPFIVIHQYMTDLATPGAIHFFHALDRLSQEQLGLIKLYGLGITHALLKKMVERRDDLNGYYQIKPYDNPMVRLGFYNRDKSLHASFDKTVSVGYLVNQSTDKIIIHAYEKVASIMLGSQAGDATTEYVKHLLNNGYDKIFVFGGQNQQIKSVILSLFNKDNAYSKRIILLGHQTDKEMLPIMTRSQLLVIRGGGLSIMEQLLMLHHTVQKIFIHHNGKALKSGISWEDGNVDGFIVAMQELSIFCQKTCPELFQFHLRQREIVQFKEKLLVVTDNDKSQFYLASLIYVCLYGGALGFKSEKNLLKAFFTLYDQKTKLLQKQIISEDVFVQLENVIFRAVFLSDEYSLKAFKEEIKKCVHATDIKKINLSLFGYQLRLIHALPPKNQVSAIKSLIENSDFIIDYGGFIIKSDFGKKNIVPRHLGYIYQELSNPSYINEPKKALTKAFNIIASKLSQECYAREEYSLMMKYLFSKYKANQYLKNNTYFAKSLTTLFESVSSFRSLVDILKYKYPWQKALIVETLTDKMPLLITNKSDFFILSEQIGKSLAIEVLFTLKNALPEVLNLSLSAEAFIDVQNFVYYFGLFADARIRRFAEKINYPSLYQLPENLFSNIKQIADLKKLLLLLGIEDVLADKMLLALEKEYFLPASKVQALSHQMVQLAFNGERIESIIDNDSHPFVKALLLPGGYQSIFWFNHTNPKALIDALRVEKSCALVGEIA